MDYCFGGDLSTSSEFIGRRRGIEQSTMIFLGQTISQPEPVAERLVAEQVIAIMSDFLGGPLSVPYAEVIEMLKAALSSFMILCDDYMGKIDAIIECVAGNLEDHGIDYLIRGYFQRGK